MRRAGILSFEEQLLRALELDLGITSAANLALPLARPASVLALFGGDPADPSLLLTRRTEKVESHKGQIALPGGVRDPEDPDEIATALRETHEEVGIEPERVRVLGRLPEFGTFTGFQVTPIVGVLQSPPAELVLRPNPDEIEEVFWARLSVLLDPAMFREESIRHGAVQYSTPIFQVGSHRVWGITGLIVKNLLDRLQAIRVN